LDSITLPVVPKMDKKLIESFVYSIISFLGIGMGFILLILFLVKGKTEFITLVLPIVMILFGLFGVVSLFSEK